MSPGLGVPGTEVIFPLSPKLAIRGRFDSEEDVVHADKDTVAGINSLLISNCQNLRSSDVMRCLATTVVQKEK